MQLLKYRHLDPLPDPAIANLTKLVFLSGPEGVTVELAEWSGGG